MKIVIPPAAARIRRKIWGMLQIAVVYAVAYWVVRGGLTMDRSGIRGLKPPFIVLGNHTSFLDPALVQIAVAPHICYFLTTNFYFRHPVLGGILRRFGAIPKVQFWPDLRSTRGALAAIARGDVVGIFPEGRRSIDGSCCSPLPDSIARFIKKARVPVVFVKTAGGYLLWPRWSSFWRSGRVETVATQLLSAAEVCTMDTGQVYSVVAQAMAYNDYDWNRGARALYCHRRAAERLHLILHQCPRCLAEQTMTSQGTRLVCHGCGNTALLDRYGFFQPLDKECVVFDDPVKWAAWQRETMRARWRDENFLIEAVVDELRVADKFYGAYRRCGQGRISLRHEGLYFHGRVDGQMTDLFFPIETMPTISTEFGHDFEVCDDRQAWWIFLADEQQTIRLENAIALLHEANVKEIVVNPA